MSKLFCCHMCQILGIETIYVLSHDSPGLRPGSQSVLQSGCEMCNLTTCFAGDDAWMQPLKEEQAVLRIKGLLY